MSTPADLAAADTAAPLGATALSIDPRARTLAGGTAPVDAVDPGGATVASAGPSRAGTRVGWSPGGERYVIERELARGGMGRISIATDRLLDRQVAIKELVRPNEALAARFERERALTSKLQHPAIVSIHDAGAWPDGEPYYVMRLVSGESLDRVIARYPGFAERLALLPHAIAAVDALAYAHAQHVIHRDLKPANILVGEFGETVVIDWGLAKDLRTVAEPAAHEVHTSSGETEHGSVLGTPAFMAPEQALGDVVDARADVYALGAVLYATFAGVAPYAGPSTDAILARVLSAPPTPIRELVPAIPPDLATIIEKAMARDPSDRYGTAAELASELKRFQQGQLVAAHRYTWADRLRRRLRKHRAAALVAAAGLVLLAVVGAASLRRVFVEQARAERARDEALHNRDSAEDVMRYVLGQMRDRLAELGKLELLETPARKVLAYYGSVGAKSEQDLYQRARAHANLSDVLTARGDGDGAWVEASTSHMLRQLLLARDPTDEVRLRAVATSQDRLGELLAARGDPLGARRAYEASLALVERLASPDPETRRDMFVSLLLIGGSSTDAGDLERAAEALSRAKEIAAELAAAAPGDRDARRDLSVAHQRLGIAHKARGALPAAAEELRAALALSAALLDHAPDDVESIRDHATNHDVLAFILLAQGDPRGAMVEIRATRALAARLVEREPANLAYQRTLLTTRVRLVEAMIAANELAGARLESAAALAHATRIAEADPTNLDDRRTLAVITNKIGQQQLAANQPAQALERFRSGLAIAKDLVTSDPRPALRRDLAFSHRQMAEAARALGDTAAAEASLRAALTILGELVAAEPDMLQAQADLALTHKRLAMLVARRDPAMAATARRTARAILEGLVAHDPTNAEWQENLASESE